MKTITTASLAIMLLTTTVVAQGAANNPSEVTLFKHVKVFDGTSQQLKDGLDVLVVQNMIKEVRSEYSIQRRQAGRSIQPAGEMAANCHQVDRRAIANWPSQECAFAWSNSASASHGLRAGV